jgi:hypothetical protein
LNSRCKLKLSTHSIFIEATLFSVRKHSNDSSIECSSRLELAGRICGGVNWPGIMAGDLARCGTILPKLLSSV